MKSKIVIAVGIGLIATALIAQASQQTSTVSSTRIVVRSINDNMMGFRPENAEPVDTLSKPIFELFAPAAIMVTDAELNNYFLYGAAHLDFSEYFAVKLSDGRRYLCPTVTFSEACETVTAFQAHGKSLFQF
jgi:hypothetical protein